MKKFIYLIIMLLLFMFNGNDVKADCDENIDELKVEAKKIEITYKLNEEYYVNEEKVTGTFIIEIKNMPSTMFARILGPDIYIWYEEDNVIVKDGIEDGTKKIAIYSEKCGIHLRTVSVKIPKYNKYSEREECIGIDTEELDVCDKWYPYELNESTFQYKINKYIEKQQEKQEQQIEKEKTKVMDTIIEFLKNYYIYIIMGIVTIVLITLLIVVRKKRYSLE